MTAITDTNQGVLVKKNDALVGAAVSAAVGLAVYGLRKALDGGGGGGLSLRESNESDADDRVGYSRPRGDSLLATAWGSASHSLLPLAEDAADAAGKWAAKNSPAFVRDRLLPRFIESFKAA